MFKNERFNRKHGMPAHRLIIAGPFGITIWRKGAVSLQAYGHFLQVVIGDWWKAT
jgi:hypothetical protein